jgi:hypothetical protein
MNTPALFETIALNGDGYDKLPPPKDPYYVLAREGSFLHKKTQIGTVLVKQPDLPKTFGRVGYQGGVFNWEGAKVPKEIISSAHDFFRRIFAKHHAEAEVLITMHNDTRAFRLFVPYQRVNHSGVKSIYEPSHIDRNYTVVGTIHSHCDFTAFHSGTDSGDASDMDGVHFTIGHVDTDKPEIVGMVAMNGKEFHYTKPEDIAEIEWGTKTAPEWWDQYVFAEGNAPTEKPVSLKTISTEHWNEFLGLALVRPKQTWGYQHTGASYPVGHPGYRVPQTDYTQRRWIPGDRGSLPTVRPYRDHDQLDRDWMDASKTWRPTVRDSDRLKRQKDKDERYADQGLELDRIDTAIEMAEEMGVFSHEDWQLIKAGDMDEIEYWRGYFKARAENLNEVLGILGVRARTKYSPIKERNR